MYGRQHALCAAVCTLCTIKFPVLLTDGATNHKLFAVTTLQVLQGKAIKCM